MSYILDALKKSEKERRRGEQPDVFAPQVEPPSLSLSGPRWKKIIGWSFAGGLVLLAFVGYLTATRSPKTEQPVQETANTTIPAPPTTPAPPAVRQQPAPPEPHLADKQHEPAESTTPHSSLSLSAEKHRKQQPDPEDAKAEHVNIVVKPIDIQPGSMPVVSYNELPATLRDALPELKFAGHAYAQTPLARLIIINNKILREGDRVTPDLQLLEITPKGVILNFRGKHFSMDLE